MIATHKRTRGLQLVYTIDYDANGYAIRHLGELRKEGGATLVGAQLSAQYRSQAQLRIAIADIEDLMGMIE